MSSTVLTIKNLTFGYSKDKLLYENFNLEIKRGELVSIVGSSGSGKSTLFELIVKNIKPLNGEVTAKKIGWIFQDPYSSFHPSYSVVSQVLEVAEDREYQKYLSRLKLDEKLLEKKPHELSGGQLQRCSILRAILTKADLLLCDEPTSALDNIVQLDTMKLLISLLDSFAIILITHDLDLAKWASDKIIVIGEANEF